MRLYGGPADGWIVDGIVHSSRWLSVPVPTAGGFCAAVYERSGDVFLYIDDGARTND
jgi:hypothetical protein